MGPDSTPRKVLETMHGFGKMIEVRPIKGKPFVVSEDHVLTVIQTRLKKHPKPSEDTEGIIKDIRVSELLRLPSWYVRPNGLYKLMRTGVDFPQMPVGPIDAYFLGVYLGDGSSAHGQISITSADAQIATVVISQSGKYLLKVRQYSAGQAQQYVLTPGRTGGQALLNGLAKDLIALGLYKKTSESKFIPPQYKFGSQGTRLEVLAGLLDTDGSLDTGYFDISTKSKQLAEDVAFVSRSLGFYAFVREKSSHDQFGHEGLYYRVGISGNISKIPTRVSRKQASTRRQKKSVLRTGFTLKPMGEEEYFGFRVDSDQRYLLDDFTVTHNSGKTMLAKKLGAALEKKALLYGNRVKFLHVNCRIDKTLQSVLIKGLHHLGHRYPSRGFSFEELVQTFFDELKNDRVHMVIAFDEVDSLASSDPSSIYTITRFREVSYDTQIFSSLLISKTLDYLKMLDLSTLSSIQWNTVSLDPYSGGQLHDILLSRSEAFNEGCLGDEPLQLTADIASVYGDARYALDLLYRAGKLADLADSPLVLPEHVRQAKAFLPPQFRKEELAYLDKNQRLLLIALSSLLKKSDSAYATMGEVEKSYDALCESLGIDANHHTSVWNNVNELSRKGIIQTQLSSKGLRGKTTLVGLSVVSAKQLIDELEKGMVADVRG